MRFDFQANRGGVILLWLLFVLGSIYVLVQFLLKSVSVPYSLVYAVPERMAVIPPLAAIASNESVTTTSSEV